MGVEFKSRFIENIKDDETIPEDIRFGLRAVQAVLSVLDPWEELSILSSAQASCMNSMIEYSDAPKEDKKEVVHHTIEEMVKALAFQWQKKYGEELVINIGSKN